MILFGFAGLAAAGNSMLLVISRRTELAVLKAIGLTTTEVALMILVEVVGLAWPRRAWSSASWPPK